LLCTLFDLLLIGLGVGGVGTALAADARVLTVTTLGGATFLLGYGVRALHAAWYSPAVADDNSCQMRGASAALSVKGTVLATLSFSFLNPAAYLDTMLMIGTTSSRYPIDERLYFGTGAVLASALWFFTLTYGASRLTPLFRHRAAWRTLDVVSGCIMVGLAAALSATQSFWFW
jgi:L-lysine exporter family protein LysE/ArgO